MECVSITQPIAIRRTEQEWQEVLGDFDSFQYQVFEAAQRTDDDTEILAARLFDIAIWIYAQTLITQAAIFGVYVSQVSLTNPELLALIEQQIWESASSIVNTYNYDLAHAIQNLAEIYIDLDAWVYAQQLFGPNGWWDERRKWKDSQIGVTETWRQINQAIGGFYQRNPALPIAYAEVVPYAAVCPDCDALVMGNPYPPERIVGLANMLPLHINCPHYVRVVPSGRAQGPLWLGE